MNISVNEILFRLLLAILIGGVIGYEREFNHRAAGFRTHILVCVGATIVSIIQINIGNKAIELVNTSKELANVIKIDYSRLGAQVISGVGFLGAGAIIHNKGNIKGLTTAASLWVLASLGLAIGIGDYITSLLGFVFIVITLVFLKKVETKFIDRQDELRFQVRYVEGILEKKSINEILEKNSVVIKGIEVLGINKEECMYERRIISINYIIVKPKHLQINKIFNSIIEMDEVLMIRELEGD